MTSWSRRFSTTWWFWWWHWTWWLKPKLQQVLQHVLHGWPWSKVEAVSQLWIIIHVQTELLMSGSGCCLLQGRCIYCRDDCGNLPMKDIHASAALRPDLDSDLRRFVCNCIVRIAHGIQSTKPTLGLLQPARFLAGPQQKLFLNTTGEFVTASPCHRYMMVA